MISGFGSAGAYFLFLELVRPAAAVVRIEVQVLVLHVEIVLVVDIRVPLLTHMVGLLKGRVVIIEVGRTTGSSVRITHDTSGLNYCP